MTTRRALLMGGTAALGLALSPALPEQAAAAPTTPSLDVPPTPRVMLERLAEIHRLVDSLVRESCSFLTYRGGFSEDDLKTALAKSNCSPEQISKFASIYPGGPGWDGWHDDYTGAPYNPLVDASDPLTEKVVLPYAEVSSRLMERLTCILGLLPELVEAVDQPETVYPKKLT